MVNLSASLETTEKTGSLISRLLLSAQKQVGPSRVMFERIFLKGESEADVVQSLGLTTQDYQQMLRNLTISIR